MWGAEHWNQSAEASARGGTITIRIKVSACESDREARAETGEASRRGQTESGLTRDRGACGAVEATSIQAQRSFRLLSAVRENG